MNTRGIYKEAFPVELGISHWHVKAMTENIIQLQSSFATALDHLRASCCMMVAQEGTQA